MRKFILFLIVLVLAVWAGIKIAEDPGYTLLVYRQWSVELPLWLAFAIAFFAFAFFYFVIKLIAEFGFYNQRVGYWAKRRKHQQAHKLLCRGLIELLEGNWKQAEKHLTTKVLESETPLVNYLMAANAAHEQQAFDRRDEYLLLAHRSEPDAKIAIGLTKANLQIKQQQLEQALASLQHLRAQSPKHKYVLKSLAKLFVELNDWEHLQALLSSLKKQQVFNETQYNQLIVKAYVGLIKQTNDVKQLQTFWDEVPKAQRRTPAICAAYANCLLQYGDDQQAQKAVYDVLSRKLDDGLLSIYGKINADVDRQYKHCLQWQKIAGNNASLDYAMANLAVKLQLWGQAKENYELSLQLHPDRQVFWDYAMFLESQGQHDLARQVYRTALEKSLHE